MHFAHTVSVHKSFASKLLVNSLYTDTVQANLLLLAQISIASNILSEEIPDI